MFVKELLNEYKLECQIRKLSPRTITGYFNNNNLFQNFISREFNIVAIEEINHQIIKKYVLHLLKNKAAETYINSILKSLTAFFKYCVLEGYINENPCKKVRWLKEPKVIINAFIDSEVSAMLNALDYSSYIKARNKTILAFLLDTGMRNLELCSLRNQDIKDSNIAIVFGKGNKERNVGVSPLLEKYIFKYERIKEQYFLSRNVKVDNYFLSRNGRKLTVGAIEKILNEAGNIAGIRKEIRCMEYIK